MNEIEFVILMIVIYLFLAIFVSFLFIEYRNDDETSRKIGLGSGIVLCILAIINMIMYGYVYNNEGWVFCIFSLGFGIFTISINRK